MSFPLPRLLLIAGLACALGGCKRQESRVYTAPKDQAPVVQTAAKTEGATPTPRAQPQLTWSLPPGWKETGADRMSLANFVIGSDAGNATVNITPLTNLEGREAMVINMWRDQLGQPPLGDDEAAAALTDVEIAGGKGKLMEMTGERGGKTQRTVIAIQHTPSASLFYKLAGDEAAVAAQRTAFLDFLKSVRMQEAAAATAQPSVEPPQQFAWSVPAGWRTLAVGQMQVAKFAVPDQGAAKAEVTVSTFPNDTGGTRANVDRWRGQLGLGPIDDAALAQSVMPLDSAMPGAELIDLAHEGRRIFGAIVPRDGRWWFYKLMGDAAAVEAAREAFTQFAKSTP